MVEIERPGALETPTGRVSVACGIAPRISEKPAELQGLRGPSADLISVIRKNAAEEIRVELTEFNGHQLINIRVWTEPRNGGSERIPTKAGIACRVALLPEIIEALQQAEAQARARGLL